MFTKDTAIILGAGSSIPFGLPSGEQLAEKIQSSLSAIRRDASSGVRDLRGGALNSFISKPHQYMYSNLPNEVRARPDWRGEHLLDFERTLQNSPQTTIDRFLFENERFRYLGKIFITTALIATAYKIDSIRNVLSLNRFNDIQATDWAQPFLTRIREGASDADALEGRSRVQIVTFNYDTVLEHIIKTHLCNTERHQGGDHEKICPIHHVHGKILMPPEIQVSELIPHILDQSTRFNLIHEEPAEDREFLDFSATELDRATSCISNADEIFALGFAFDEFNTEVIDFNGRYAGDSVYALNFDGNLGFARRLSRLDVPAKNILSGTQQNPMGCATAINAGFL